MNKLADRLEEETVMIDDCMKRESRMTPWECDFIQSISEYRDGGGFLSNKQIDILNEIWDRVTEAG